MVVYCGGNNYENPPWDVVRLKNKVMRIINDVPIHDHTTSNYIYLHHRFLYDLIHNKKSSKFSNSFISEQHNYATLNNFWWLFVRWLKQFLWSFEQWQK